MPSLNQFSNRRPKNKNESIYLVEINAPSRTAHPTPTTSPVLAAAATRAYSAHPIHARFSSYLSAPALPSLRVTPVHRIRPGAAISCSPSRGCSSPAALAMAAPPLSPLSLSAAVGIAALGTRRATSLTVFRRPDLRLGRLSFSSSSFSSSLRRRCWGERCQR